MPMLFHLCRCWAVFSASCFFLVSNKRLYGLFRGLEDARDTIEYMQNVPELSSDEREFFESLSLDASFGHIAVLNCVTCRLS